MTHPTSGVVPFHTPRPEARALLSILVGTYKNSPATNAIHLSSGLQRHGQYGSKSDPRGARLLANICGSLGRCSGTGKSHSQSAHLRRGAKS